MYRNHRRFVLHDHTFYIFVVGTDRLDIRLIPGFVLCFHANASLEIGCNINLRLIIHTVVRNLFHRRSSCYNSCIGNISRRYKSIYHLFHTAVDLIDRHYNLQAFIADDPIPKILISAFKGCFAHSRSSRIQFCRQRPGFHHIAVRILCLEGVGVAALRDIIIYKMILHITVRCLALRNFFAYVCAAVRAAYAACKGIGPAVPADIEFGHIYIIAVGQLNLKVRIILIPPGHILHDAVHTGLQCCAKGRSYCITPLRIEGNIIFQPVFSPRISLEMPRLFAFCILIPAHEIMSRFYRVSGPLHRIMP